MPMVILYMYYQYIYVMEVYMVMAILTKIVTVVNQKQNSYVEWNN